MSNKKQVCASKGHSQTM